MLDINLFREEKGGEPERVRESQRRRHADVALVDRVVELDTLWRQSRFRLDECRQQLNALSKQVGQRKKAGEDASELIGEVGQIKARMAEIEAVTARQERERDAVLRGIGNLVHESVVVSADEARNAPLRAWGDAAERTRRARWSHVDLLIMLGAADYDKGAKVAGSRGYFLKGVGARLNLALIQYSMRFLEERGYTAVQTPYFMTRDAMTKCAQLDDFDEQLYKVVESSSSSSSCADETAAATAAQQTPSLPIGAGVGAEAADSTDKYLIATAEQPMCAFHMDEWIHPHTLPLLYAGYSTCFRKEAGSHGRDQLGIFRVHQFEKVEQFVLTSPHDGASWHMMERMMDNAEAFHRSLDLPYRVVSIVSGALNNAAAKKYDLEAWFPASEAWRELVSCSNCTDYQARRLETRYGAGKKMGEREKAYVHMLNSTLCATTRVICCLVENHQREDGVVVPEALRPYMGGDAFLPFVAEAPRGAKPKRDVAACTQQQQLHVAARDGHAQRQ